MEVLLCCPKRKGKKWTHTSPNGHLSQIDFIAINKNWIDSAKNCEAYNTFEGVFSDPTMRNRFTITLNNRYDALKSHVRSEMEKKSAHASFPISF